MITTTYGYGRILAYDVEADRFKICLTDGHNMEVFVRRFNSTEYSKFDMFLHSIQLDNNFCNFKNNSYKTIKSRFICKIKYLRRNSHIQIAEYLESLECEIKPIYDFLSKIVDKYSENRAEQMFDKFMEKVEARHQDEK